MTTLHSACQAICRSIQNAIALGLYSVFDDKSRSVKSARIAPLQEQDMMTLINILRQTGGELSFGLIGESSDRPLLRLRIPVPPPLPVKRNSAYKQKNRATGSKSQETENPRPTTQEIDRAQSQQRANFP